MHTWQFIWYNCIINENNSLYHLSTTSEIEFCRKNSYATVSKKRKAVKWPDNKTIILSYLLIKSYLVYYKNNLYICPYKNI